MPWSIGHARWVAGADERLDSLGVLDGLVVLLHYKLSVYWDLWSWINQPFRSPIDCENLNWLGPCRHEDRRCFGQQNKECSSSSVQTDQKMSES
jgi:hypothetical protein